MGEPLVPPAIEEADSLEELGWFFKSRGEVCFSPPGDHHRYPGAAAAVAVVPRAGAVFFADTKGEI